LTVCADTWLRRRTMKPANATNTNTRSPILYLFMGYSFLGGAEALLESSFPPISLDFRTY
jgi:hypothetical protein